MSLWRLVALVIPEYPREKLLEAVQKLRSGQVAGRCVVHSDLQPLPLKFL